MGIGMADTANTVYRDFVTDGIPSSGKHDPHKPDIRRLLTGYEQIINAFTSNGGLIYSSKAALDADLTRPANSMAWVMGDATVANNGIYRKVGGSGTGSWTRVADLPFSFIIASDVGAGTPNAIQATTSIPVSSSALVWTNIFEANTSSPVTISFNGGAALTIKTNSGNNPVVGGLTAGMIVMGIVSGSTFRLISDQASAAVLAAAEAAADRAEAAQADAETAQIAAEAAQDAAEAAAAGVSLPPVAANRMLVDNSAGTARESKTFSDVRALLDPVTTQLYGANSLARSIPARFSDTVNLRDWLDRTGGAGTETANNTALTALIAYLTANPTVRTLKGNMGDVYRIGGNINFTFPNAVRLMMDGAEFDANVAIGTGASTLFTFNSKCVVDGLVVHVLSGSTFRRLIDFMDQNRVRDMLVYADTQIANSGSSPLLDYAVRYRGQKQNVRGAKIVNIDRAHFAYGDGGDGVPSLEFRLEDIEAESYVTGLNLRNLLGAINRGYRCKTRAANATDDPGHNGIIHEGVAEYLLSDFVVKDSGEHGIRFGGTRNSEQLSRVITVGNGSIWRSGQTGFKMFTGTAGASFQHVNVSNVNVVDCQYEPSTPGELPGFNDEGFLLQQIRQGVFKGLRVSKQDSFTGFSCMDGVYISGGDNVLIEGVQVMDAKRNAVRISEWDGDTTANPETLANNEVMIRGLQGENIGEDGIYIDHVTQSLRDINIEGEVIGNGAAGFYACRMSGAVARFVQPSIAQLKHRNFAAGGTNLATTGNWKFRDVFGSTY